MSKKLTVPVMNCKVAVGTALGPPQRYITFWAGTHTVGEFEQFGNVEQFKDEMTKYYLYVDGRFDFDEVVAYIENFGA